jgi:hypothetical protein
MNKKNVENLKNILQGKEIKKNISVGYNAPQKEFGDEYEQKNGYKVKKTRFDDIRVPLFCPKCDKVMKGSKDTSAYYSNGSCLNCMVDYHYELQTEGKLEEFMFRKRILNAQSWLNEQRQQLQEFVKSKNYNPEFVLSDGTIEKWNFDGNISEIIDSYRGDLDKFEINLNNSINEYEKKYNKKPHDE